MYRCDSQTWLTLKKAECQRTGAFELWCWRRLLRILWTVKRSNQSFLKEINPEYSFEGLMLKLKLQSFRYLMRRADSLENSLMLGTIEGKRRGKQRMRWLYSITASIDMNLSKFGEIVKDRWAWLVWCCRLGQDLVTKQQDQKRQGEGEVTRTGRVHSSSYGCPWKRGPQLNVQPMREECTHWQPKSEMRELVENTLFPLCPLSPFLPASFLSSGIPYLFIPLL